ncbi:MAG: Yip1 family protein [Candidatus Micrarchaeota archaeon]
MSETSESEAAKGLDGLIRQYKEFAFRGMRQVPYGAVPSWINYADGRIAEALAEKRSVMQSLKDSYALSVLGILFAMAAFWYFSLAFGGMLASMAVLFVFLGSLLAPNILLVIGALIAAIVAVLIAPAVLSLINAAVYHVVAKILGGSGDFSDTFRVQVASGGAQLVLMIPMYCLYAIFIGLFLSPIAYIVSFYSIYLQYLGIKHVHNLSPKRAIAATLLPIASWYALCAVLYFGFYAIMVGMSLLEGG